MSNNTENLNKIIDNINIILTAYPFNRIDSNLKDSIVKIEEDFCYKLISLDNIDTKLPIHISLKHIPGANRLNDAIDYLQHINFDELNEFKLATLKHDCSFDKDLYSAIGATEIKTVIISIYKNMQFPTGHWRRVYMTENQVVDIDLPKLSETEPKPTSPFRNPSYLVKFENYIRNIVDEATNKVFEQRYGAQKMHPKFKIEEFKGIENQLFTDFIDALEPIPRFREYKYTYKIIDLYATSWSWLGNDSNEGVLKVHVELDELPESDGD